ncbi:MAG TPA: 3-phosphoshikimate 1-carboxyvinyltransferase [Candidatus Aquilonibacter sp.]|nr:3-phosphoshikimate 1-carboxyvinyltransferase [Candidatus Aquilonibacter sp.]
MALPDLIEIVPLDKPVRAEITVPGSKSITNRALILAALADGEVTLTGALWSEDTQIMVECLQELGFIMNVAPDPNETCNRTITVYGMGGKVPGGGTKENPLELFVGNAGTAARFLSAFVCLGNGVYCLSGVPRMHERPQAALFSALRELGYRVESENGNDKLPARIFGAGPRNGQCKVSIAESSQFASALLLCAKTGGWKIEIVGENDEESPYVEMTRQLCAFGVALRPQFEGVQLDASSASYFWASKWISDSLRETKTQSINVKNWIVFRLRQIDSDFPRIFSQMFGEREERITVSRRSELGDSIMTAIVMSPFANHLMQFTDLGPLRLQETERVVALRTELTKCGAKVVEEGDTLTVFPSQLHGAEIETYNDHRMAMCFSILGLKVPGIKIKNPACVKKTFPNFFQKLTAQPPKGLGATILDAKSGRKLGVDELFAD